MSSTARRSTSVQKLVVGDKLSVGIYSQKRTLIDVIRPRHRDVPARSCAIVSGPLHSIFTKARNYGQLAEILRGK